MVTEEDIASIKRRQAIAQMLMEQGQQDIPMQTAGGMVVPVSPLQGISKIANMLSGAYIGNKADKESARIKQARMDALGSIDFNSPDAANELARNGLVEEAIKMRMSKAEKEKGNYFQPTNVQVKGPDGKIYLKRYGSLPGNEVLDNSEIPVGLTYLDTGEGFKPMPTKDISPMDVPKPRYKTNNEIIDAVIEAESNGNPNAVSPKGAKGIMQLMPDTAKNPGFGIEPVKNDSVEENIRVGSAYLKELAKKYGGDQEKAFAAYNWGTGNLDNALAQYGESWKAHAPKETKDYVAKLDGLLGGGVIKKHLTPAQEMQYSPVVAGEIKKAETEATIPGEVKKEQLKSQIKVGEVKQTEAIKNDAEIDKNRRANDQKLKLGAEKGMKTLDTMYKYLYPNSKTERDEKGRLIPPKEKMILGNSVPDRLQMAAHEYGVHSDQASNLKGIQRLVNNMVLDKNNGSLGAGVSNADVEFLQKLQGVVEKAQDPKDIYNAIADNEDSFKRLVDNAPSTLEKKGWTVRKVK